MIEQINDNSKFTQIRLPKNIAPKHYEICLKLDFDNFTFEGHVNIDFNKICQDRTSEIVLHSNDIKIYDATIGDNRCTKAFYSPKSETVTLEFSSIVDDTGNLSIDYRGNINNMLRGLYRSSFTLDDNIVWLATTQLASTEARRMFPCWDEPAIKATFNLSVSFKRWLHLPNGRKIEYIALSNTAISSQSGDNEMIVKFKTTPKMSTYLLALTVGPFEYIEKSDGKRPIRVYARIGKKEMGNFALDIACKSLQFYENYFGIEYPLEKMDLIAVPDFAFGAMENWGSIIYRESALLADSDISTTATKQRIAIIVVHELAHQWFGNLVTMEWWTHLWLNEGFACFMEHFCTDHILPAYNIWSQFVSGAYSLALNLDSNHNSHPIEVPVYNPSEVIEIFDVISYKKGASIIRMLNNYIGDESFKEGIRLYLGNFSYGNASTEDLWDSLEIASNRQLRTMMSSWTSKMGYPLLSVSIDSSLDDNVKLKLSQEKFSIDGMNSEEEMRFMWHIPIATINSENFIQPSDTFLMDSKTCLINVSCKPSSWIKLNPGAVGLYRVMYCKELFEKFKLAIVDKTFSPMDRLDLQSDFFALSLAGKLDAVSYLEFLINFKGETNYCVWSSINDSMEQLNSILSYTDFQENFHRYGRCLYQEIFKKLGWVANPNEDHLDTLMRAFVLEMLANLGDRDVIEESKRRFKAHIEKKEIIPADFKKTVYKSISRYGNDADFEILFNLYQNTDLSEERNTILLSLSSAMDLKRLDRVIKFSFSENVRVSDLYSLFRPLGLSQPELAWKVLQDKKDYLRQRLDNSVILPNLIKFATQNFASENKAQELINFFQNNEFNGTERTLQQSLESIRLKASWLARESQAVKNFLSSWQ